MPDISHTGGCRCGAVRFEADSEPHHVSYCHCVDCRRASGAPVLVFVGFRDYEVVYSGEAPKIYGSDGVGRSFCGTCGTPLSYADKRLAGLIYFTLGALDEPERYVPTLHAYVSQQLPYLHISDGLPRRERTSVLRPTE